MVGRRGDEEEGVGWGGEMFGGRGELEGHWKGVGGEVGRHAGKVVGRDMGGWGWLGGSEATYRDNMWERRGSKRHGHEG